MFTLANSLYKYIVYLKHISQTYKVIVRQISCEGCGIHVCYVRHSAAKYQIISQTYNTNTINMCCLRLYAYAD